MSIFSALRRPRTLLKDKYAGHPLRVFIATLKGFFLVHLIWDHFYAYSPLRGPSMLPSFEVMGDSVIVDRWYRRGRGIKVGDVVTFDSVIHPGEKVVKRILGMEGDYVLSHTPESGSDAMIQIPQGHCWVVGDNLPASRDSRMFGPLPMALIKGKIIYKVLPFAERGPTENTIVPVL